MLLALATGSPELADVMLTTIEQAPTTPFSLRDALPPDPTRTRHQTGHPNTPR